MKRIALVLLAALALLVCSLSATASAHTVVDSFCSPTGDYCTGVFREQGRVKLSISTFSFTGDYELCVKPPGEARECKTYLLRTKPHGIYSSQIDFARNFSDEVDGRYAVSWHLQGTRLGSALHFSQG